MTPQLTLVAFYGAKEPKFSDFIEGCRRMAVAALGGAFRPYETGQIHATLVGLEHQKESPRENAGFRRLRGRPVAMDIQGYLDYLCMSSELPFEVQIGGFDETDCRFLSRNTPPYERAFSVQGDKAVVIGWPRRTRADSERVDYPLILDALRRRAQEFGILHAYHRLETDLDNDLFFRIGLVDPGAVSEDTARDLEHRIRRHMGEQPPLILRVGLDDLHIAVYEDERLPLDSTGILPLSATDLRAKLEAAVSPRTG